MSLTNIKAADDVCIVCCKNIDIYAFGVCDHPVCFECSTRMRVLCRQNECPICRQELPEVIFLKSVQKYEECNFRKYIADQKYHIWFQSSDVLKAYEKLLEHSCKICKDRVFINFSKLKEHMRKEHEQFYCEICVENLKIFSSERKSYSRQELARHRRIGDPDNTSHRGHPLCEFCDERHLDKDELFRHLRREHFFCHFCDADGLHEFYGFYEDLRSHFLTNHFLCEEGSCREEKFTSAFRTDLDLKFHKATVHNKNLSKAQAKQARTLELEFTITPRVQQSNYSRSSGQKIDVNSRKTNHFINSKRAPRNNDIEEGAVGGIQEDQIVMKKSVPYMDSSKEFPTLDGKETPQHQKQKLQSESFAQRLAKSNRFNVKMPDDSSLGSEEFPSLSNNVSDVVVQKQWKINGPNRPGLSSASSSSVVGPSKQSKSVFLQLKGDFPSLPSNKSRSSKVSIHVNPIHNSLAETGRKEHRFYENVVTIPYKVPAETVKTTQEITLTDNDFPQLTEESNKSHEPQWISMKTANKIKTKSAINSGSQMGNRNTSTNCDRKSSSVTIPIHNSKINLQNIAESVLSSTSSSGASSKGKTKKKKTKNVGSNENAEPVLGDCNKLSTFASEPNKKKKKDPYIEDIKEREENQENENPQFDKSPVQSSELHINTFCKDVNINDVADDISEQTSFLAMADFPELPRKPNKYEFLNDDANNDPVNNRPPPGFNVAVKSINKPPPGFQVTINSVTQSSNCDGVSSSFTSKKEDTHKIDFSCKETCTYHEPENFQQRNLDLITKIQSIVEHDESHFGAFKILSGQFRQDTITASNYYQQCLNLIGKKEFSEIFPELLVLLPDIGKQRELLSVHNTYVKDKGAFNSNVLSNGNEAQFLVCATCQQVLAKADFRKHMDVHDINGNFPLLSTSVSNNISWIKK